MDEKYIDNLGMSPHVDEGLWDRLKARSSGYAHAAKNLVGGTTPTQMAQFIVLFKKLCSRSLKTLEDFLDVIRPYINGGNVTTDQYHRAYDMKELSLDLQRITSIMTEANMFTRPFSALGAQASGNVDNIIKAYQTLLKRHYDEFFKDARKLNIFPEQILNKDPDTRDSLMLFKQAMGMETGAPSEPPTPDTEPPPVAPSEPPTPEPPPSPVAPVPPKPTAAPIPDPWSTPVPPKPTAPSGPSSETEPLMRVTTTGNMLYSLTAQTINKLVSTLQEGKYMLERIKSEGRRLRNKTVVEFDLNNPPIKAEKDGNVYKWALQYRYDKNKDSHCFDVALITTDPRGQVSESDRWMPFMEYGDLDVISTDELGKVRTDFDIISNIEKTNPELGKIIRQSMAEEGDRIDPALNNKIAEVFADVATAMDPEPVDRNIRARTGTKGDEEDAPEKAGGEDTGGGEAPPAPPAPPAAPEMPKSSTPGEPASPEKAARTITPPPVKDKPSATGVARKKEPTTKPVGKSPSTKKPAVATSVKPKPSHKVAKRPVKGKGKSSVTEEFTPNFKDFFPL